MATPKIYGDLLSQPTRMVLQVAALAGKDVDFVRVNLLAGELSTPKFLALNPTGQIPTLQDGNYSLYESNAICKYLLTDQPGHFLYPDSAQVRGHIDQWLDWKHGGLREGATGMLRREMAKPIIDAMDNSSPLPAYAVRLKRTLKEIPLEREQRLLIEALRILETQLAKTKLFLVEHTDKPTLADLAVFEEVAQLSLLPSNEPLPRGRSFAEFPHVEAWLDRIYKANLARFGEFHKTLIKAKSRL